MLTLPIDLILDDVRALLRAGHNLVIEAPPGAGKTTRVPSAALEAVAGEVIVLEPRRLAARLAARRVAEERGETVGEVVGYQVRFEDVVGPRTRLRFVTEGILLRRLLSDPTLRGVGCVVLDELHERHLQADLALALLRRLQLGTRKDLRLIAMSATLDAAPVARFLGGCPSLRAEGRRFEVAVEHAAVTDDLTKPLEGRVAAAVRRLVQEGPPGDILVFLPGAAEIARARTACAEVAERHGRLLLALHGDLSPAEQDRAVRPGEQPKIILSTNVAESSVTIPGVVAVVDSGLARVASHSPWTGLPMLRAQKISQASAAQRAGRAGRTAPGRCLRLYTRHDHDTRPTHDVPEIRRADLAETVLALHALGVRDATTMAWLDAPEAPALAAADALLARLGAVEHGVVTATGTRMLRLPLHPRLARLMVEAERRGVVEDAAIAAALLGERGLDGRGRPASSGRSDVVEAIEAFRALRGAGPAATIDRARKQIARLCNASGKRGNEDDLLIAILAGFPDRVARRRKPGAPEILLAAGGSAEIAPASVVRDAQLVVAVDVEERQTGMVRKTAVRMASAVEPEWLLDVCAGGLREERDAVWDPAGKRVEMAVRLRYDELILDEARSRPRAEDAVAAAATLARAALAAGAETFVDVEAWARWRARVVFVARAFPESGLAAYGDTALKDALVELCAGAASFAELRDAGLLDALRAHLSGQQQRLVAEMAPDRVTLAAGRQVKVEYGDAGEQPWIASRLQDFFGMTRSPAIGGGRVKLVLHLLAPNQRAVQVTSDLEGFWVRHYPAIRRELGRRYPRHKWPEDPLA